MEIKCMKELEPHLINYIERIKKKLDETDYAIYDNDQDKALKDLHNTSATILKWVHTNAMVKNWLRVYDYVEETTAKTYLKAYRAIEHLNEISEKLGLGNIISENTASTLRRICDIHKE